MNQAEIIAMLHNIIANNQQYTTWTVSTPHIVALVNQAVEAEREACAKVCDAADKSTHPADLADSIRARGQA
jgi:anti-sigma factor ChrR (cupin superfamily)